LPLRRVLRLPFVGTTLRKVRLCHLQRVAPVPKISARTRWPRPYGRFKRHYNCSRLSQQRTCRATSSKLINCPAPRQECPADCRGTGMDSDRVRPAAASRAPPARDGVELLEPVAPCGSDLEGNELTCHHGDAWSRSLQLLTTEYQETRPCCLTCTRARPPAHAF
jgi:hypothetical protein